MRNEHLLKLPDLVRYYSVSRETVYKWLAEGCPHIEIGGQTRKRRRFDFDQVDQWLKNKNERSNA